jgi:hypothetical protein
MEGDRIGLREILLGTSLGSREGEARVATEIDVHLNGLIKLIPKVYGNTEACKQAVMEVNTVVDMNNMACKRAMLLYGIATERQMCDYWGSRQADGSAALAKDLHSRVLPFVVPRFFKHSCQTPDSFVVLSLVMSEMWQGEQLGNWPSVP